MDLGTVWPFWLLIAPILVTATAVLTAIGVAVLRPFLLRIALVRPNARSSHILPTPQGGGAAVIAASLLASAAAALALPLSDGATARFAAVLVAMILLAVVGAVDDVRGLRPAPRLVLQFAAMVVVIRAIPDDWQLVPIIPWWADRILLLIGSVWLVNVVNFMDGIDWMTVAEFVPLTGALALLGSLGALPMEGILLALALCGGMIGFAPFNKPVARVFLGDVGSLPLGVALAWLLVLLASRGHLAAAVLLPLYYLADASVTLLQRLARRERVWEAHRSHFYQRARARGFSTWDVIGLVLALNVMLCTLAVATVLWPAVWMQVIAVFVGGLLVAAQLYTFAGGKRAQ